MAARRLVFDVACASLPAAEAREVAARVGETAIAQNEALWEEAHSLARIYEEAAAGRVRDDNAFERAMLMQQAAFFIQRLEGAHVDVRGLLHAGTRDTGLQQPSLPGHSQAAVDASPIFEPPGSRPSTTASDGRPSTQSSRGPSRSVGSSVPDASEAVQEALGGATSLVLGEDDGVFERACARLSEAVREEGELLEESIAWTTNALQELMDEAGDPAKRSVPAEAMAKLREYGLATAEPLAMEALRANKNVLMRTWLDIEAVDASRASRVTAERRAARRPPQAHAHTEEPAVPARRSALRARIEATRASAQAISADTMDAAHTVDDVFADASTHWDAPP